LTCERAKANKASAIEKRRTFQPPMPSRARRVPAIKERAPPKKGNGSNKEV